MELRRLRTLLVRAAMGLLGVLALTGVWLSFFYRPGTVNNTAVNAVRGVHRYTGSLLLMVLVVLLFVSVVVVAQRQSGHSAWIVATALALVGFVLSFSGFLLPWEQLALWAVTVGTSFRGFFMLFGDQVRYVLIDGTEISTGTLRAWFVVHSLVLPIVFGVLLWRARRPATKPLAEHAAV